MKTNMIKYSMKPFKTEICQPHEDIGPYIKVWFNGISVDMKDSLQTWLNSLDSVHHANVNNDDNFKLSAIVYPSPCWDIAEAQKNVDAALAKYLTETKQ